MRKVSPGTEKAVSQPRKLPEFKGCTINERLKEFRRMSCKEREPSIEFVPFDTGKGASILKAMMSGKKATIINARNP